MKKLYIQPALRLHKMKTEQPMLAGTLQTTKCFYDVKSQFTDEGIDERARYEGKFNNFFHLNGVGDDAYPNVPNYNIVEGDNSAYNVD